METTLKWLKQYVDFKISASELEELFTMSGTECEDMIPVRETGDTAFKFEITSNRTDCYGALGLAREIAAFLGAEFKEPKADYVAKGADINSLTSVTLESPELCPYYSAQLITNIKVQESPKWLLDYFETLASVKSIRPINNIADITNFVLMEYSQPLHAFDFDKLAEKRIVVRRARKGEKMHAIDDRIYELNEEMCVIADAFDPQCVGGVMGSMNSEISESTTSVLLEAAYFSPMNIRRTARKLGLHSDASYRFERGVDPGAVLQASKRAVSLILECCPEAVVHENIIEQGKIEPIINKIEFRMPAIKKCLGIEVPANDVQRIFKGLGLDVNVVKENELLEVKTPSFRRDLEREIDLVEEVGRIHGYDKIPTKSGMQIKGVKPNDSEKLNDLLKDIAIGAGYSETFSDSFVPEKEIYKFSPWSFDTSITAHNPIRSGEGLLRKSIIQSLLKIRKFNQDKGLNDAKIFESARVYLGKKETTPDEKPVFAVTGSDYFNLKGVVELILSRLGIDFVIEPRSYDLYEDGTGANFVVDGKIVAVMGKINKKSQEAFDLIAECCAAELDISVLLEAWKKFRSFSEMPKYPAIERELAIILDNDKTWQELRNIVTEKGGKLLQEVRFLEEYSGKPVPKGQKQYTFWMKFQDASRSLTSEEINEIVEKDIVNAVSENLGGSLRK